jgi:hypothetical protein
MTPATQKTLLRGIGTVLSTIGTALVGVPPEVPWSVAYHVAGAILASLGGLMVGKSDRAPGDVNPKNVDDILQGARKALGSDVVLKITSIAPPPKVSGR